MEQRIDAFVSVVAVIDDQVRDAAGFALEVHHLLSSTYQNYELVLVANDLPSHLIIEVRDLIRDLTCTRVLRLSRRLSIDSATVAGLESAIGDFVVTLTPGLDPVGVVPEVIALCRSGHDVVQGISTTPLAGTLIRRAGRRLFYWYNRRFIQVVIPSRATYLIGLSRRALNSLTHASGSMRYVRHLIRHLGYRLTDYRYTLLGSMQRKRLIRDDWLKGVEMVTSYSTHPLRWVSVLGLLIGVGNLVYGLWLLLFTALNGRSLGGWPAESLQVSVSVFALSLVLAVHGEYLGRVLVQTRREPTYFIMEEFESDTLIADVARRNVSSEPQ